MDLERFSRSAGGLTLARVPAVDNRNSQQSESQRSASVSSRLTFSTSELTKHVAVDDLLGASLFGLLNQAEFVGEVESALLAFFEELTLKLSAIRETGEMMNPNLG